MYNFRVCLILLISVCILLENVQQCNGSTLPIPAQMDGEELGEVIVSWKEEGERVRRSTDGVSVPAKNIAVSFQLNGVVVDLHLSRNDEESVNVPVYTTDGREVIRQYIPEKSNVFLYQDVKRFAAFYVETVDTSSCMFGSFEDKAEEYFLEPKERNCDRKTSPIFKILKAKTSHIEFADSVIMDKKRNLTALSQNMDTFRGKRSTPEYKIEMLLIIDYSVYNYWYTQSTAATPTQKDTEAKANIRQYYAWVISGMDVRYKNIHTATYTMSIVYGGIYIADAASKSSFTENNKDSSTPTPKVDATTVLNDVTSWVKNTAGIPSNDHAMMFSRYDFTRQGSSSNAGLAWVGAVCTDNSVSIVEDHFNFILLTVAAHELGHSLSAEHDGTNNACNGGDAYIMAASSSLVANTNPWKFSSCSIVYFTNYINTLNNGNGNCMTTLSASFDPTVLNQYTSLPGQVYDADAMCKHILGSGSSFCQFPYNNNFTSICSTLWCHKTDGSGQCQSVLGGDGLQCGNRKWCISGVCTHDNCAPPGDESCLYGDKSGVVINYNGADKTCADIPNEPFICYTSSVSKDCCKTCDNFYTGRQGCEYGDKTPGCTSANCPQHGDTICCGTCYTGSTVTTNTTTESPHLCTATALQATTTTLATTTTEQTTTTQTTPPIPLTTTTETPTTTSTISSTPQITITTTQRTRTTTPSKATTTTPSTTTTPPTTTTPISTTTTPSITTTPTTSITNTTTITTAIPTVSKSTTINTPPGTITTTISITESRTTTPSITTTSAPRTTGTPTSTITTTPPTTSTSNSMISTTETTATTTDESTTDLSNSTTTNVHSSPTTTELLDTTTSEVLTASTEELSTATTSTPADTTVTSESTTTTTSTTSNTQTTTTTMSTTISTTSTSTTSLNPTTSYTTQPTTTTTVTTTQPTTTTTVTTTQPTTTTTVNNTQPTTTTTVNTTQSTTVGRNNQRTFIFVIRLVIVVTEDLTVSTQYLLVITRAESALTVLYQRRLGSRFRGCKVRRVRRGSLIVDYDVFTDTEATATSEVISVAQDLVSGKENVTYNGQEAPVSFAAFVDSSGNNVNITSSTTGCQLLESSGTCESGYECVEGTAGPYCRSMSNYDEEMLIIIGAVIVAFSLIVVTAVVLVLCICCKQQRKEKEKHHYGVENPAMILDDFYYNGRLQYENGSSRSIGSSGMSSSLHGKRWYPGYSEMAPNGTCHQQPMNNVKYFIPRPKY